MFQAFLMSMIEKSKQITHKKNHVSTIATKKSKLVISLDAEIYFFFCVSHHFCKYFCLIRYFYTIFTKVKTHYHAVRLKIKRDAYDILSTKPLIQIELSLKMGVVTLIFKKNIYSCADVTKFGRLNELWLRLNHLRICFYFINIAFFTTLMYYLIVILC